MSGDHKIRVGSRKSELALIQTRHVISLLKDYFPEKEFEIVTMTTLGDKVLDIPLPKIGEKALFTKELETALSTGCVDLIVHSLKDLPTSLPSGLAIGAVLTRENPRDALVLQKDLSGLSLSTLPDDSVIGTSSLRRTAQLARKYPHLKIQNIRGNLNTRLKKLDELGQYQAIILAAAGLIRIGWKDRISEILTEEELLYSVGQGALAVECRSDDEEILALLDPLYDLQTAVRVTAERSFLRTLGGGCSAPVAVSSDLKVSGENEYDMSLRGAVWSLDGNEEISTSRHGVVPVKTDLRCTACPHRDASRPVGDIENLECLNRCAMSGFEPTKKRAKLDDMPAEMLKNDPHDRCPIRLPVGVDFMGQCPYLENKFQAGTSNKCPVNGKIESDAPLDSVKCPFLRGDATLSSNLVVEEGPSDDANLYCGLVVHRQATVEGMEAARRLGEKLAHDLIGKGALEVMAKAQATVHGQVQAGVR